MVVRAQRVGLIQEFPRGGDARGGRKRMSSLADLDIAESRPARRPGRDHDSSEIRTNSPDGAGHGEDRFARAEDARDGLEDAVRQTKNRGFGIAGGYARAHRVSKDVFRHTAGSDPRREPPIGDFLGGVALYTLSR